MKRVSLLPLRLARRELRGGLKRFGVFLACLVLGTAVVAGVGSLAQGVRLGLGKDAKALHGGDVKVSVTFLRLPGEALEFLGGFGGLSTVATMRAMAGAGGEQSLVDLKAVDAAYPLYGAVELEPAGDVHAALAKDEQGRFGAVADPALLTRLGLEPGDELTVGKAVFRLHAALKREPDSTGTFGLGPRLMVSQQGLEATGLVTSGTFIRHSTRLRLGPDGDVNSITAGLRERFPDTPWQVSDYRQAAPGLRTLLDRMEVYLTLVGLATLLLGGLGVAGAVDGYLAGKRRSVSTLKCLGADGGLVLRVYLAQIVFLASLGVGAGVLLGALAPAGAAVLAGDRLPFDLASGPFAGPLLSAAGYGLLTAVAFSLPPLLVSREVPPGELFRGVSGRGKGLRGKGRLYVAGAMLALAVYAVLAAPDATLAAWFVLGALAAFGCFTLLAAGLTRLAARLAASAGPRAGLALRGVSRSPAAAAGVLLSLGLGLTTLTVVGLIQGNLRTQVSSQMPSQAPSYFFIDIQPGQVSDFERLMEETPGVTRVERRPMLRGRINAINGVPADEVAVDPEVAWALRRDRGVTYSAQPPENNDITAGEWWPEGYDGPPLVSFVDNLAKGFGIGVGDTITLNILGRYFTATIANLRKVDWFSLAMNFSFIFPPGLLEGAPQTHIATVYAAPEAEEQVFKAVTGNLPGVSAIRVKEALERVAGLIGSIGTAVGAVAAVTLAAGLLVLAEALRAGLIRRRYEAVVLKTLGATRARILTVYLLEHAFLGLAAGVTAAGLGALLAWPVVTRLMGLPSFSPLPLTVLGVVGLGLTATVLLGLAGLRRTLAEKPMGTLRNE